VPAQYHAEGLDDEVLRAFDIDNAPAPQLDRWLDIMDRNDNPEGEVTIGVVGKYVGLPDAYKSLFEALKHGGLANRVKVNIKWLDAEMFEQEDDSGIAARLEPMHGILVPGGFGVRGSEGKIASVRFARERNVPFFGICLGMQMACIEGARHTAGIAAASTTEFGETKEPVVGLITEWMSAEGLQTRQQGGDMGGTMRLGAYPARLVGNSVAASIYGTDSISERHRHRYEVNVRYRDPLEEGGLIFSGMSPDGMLPEIVERPDHSWFVGVQFHPELKSKPFEPHPLFASFIAAALKQSRLV
jgi:CTP synthase